MSSSNTDIDTFETLFQTKLTEDQLDQLRRIAPHHQEIEDISPETEILVMFARRKRMVNTAWKVFGQWAIQIGKWMAIITGSLAVYSQLDSIFPNFDNNIGDSLGTVFRWLAGFVGG